MVNNKMNKIIEFLEKNNIEYSLEKFGDPYYFNDGFYVEGIQIVFYFDEIGNTLKQSKLIMDYMKRKKLYICEKLYFGAGFLYRIMTISDRMQLEQHEKDVANAIESFWKVKHKESAV